MTTAFITLGSFLFLYLIAAWTDVLEAEYSSREAVLFPGPWGYFQRQPDYSPISNFLTEKVPILYV